MAGRPKRKFSEEEIKEIERLALINCNTNTIAVALNIPFKTLKRHFAKKMMICRAKWKINLRQSQDKLKDISPDMAKFLGKNELGQTDKQTIETKQTDIKARTEQQREADRVAAKAYNEAMSRSQPKPDIIPLKRKEGA